MVTSDGTFETMGQSISKQALSNKSTTEIKRKNLTEGTDVWVS